METVLYPHDCCTCRKKYVAGPKSLGFRSCRICNKLLPNADTVVTPSRGSACSGWFTSEPPTHERDRSKRERLDPESVWR